jgi:hypothetical protein
LAVLAPVARAIAFSASQSDHTPGSDKSNSELAEKTEEIRELRTGNLFSVFSAFLSSSSLRSLRSIYSLLCLATDYALAIALRQLPDSGQMKAILSRMCKQSLS